VDWNNDGNLDILSGCYWTDKTDAGRIQILAGKGELDFEEAVDLMSGTEKPLENVVLSDGGDQGMPDNQLKNICTQQHAVDYDNDGDLDLVVGCFDRNFFYYENEGSSKENKLAEKPVEMKLVSPDMHAAPHLVDFDGDGDLDFLTGGHSGGVYISVNDGSREEPKYGEFTLLVEKPENSSEPQRPDAVQLNGSTRVWATDFNGDGLMDLLVGDSTQLSQPKDGMTEEEFEKKSAEHKKKLFRLIVRDQELRESGREMDDETREKFSNIIGELFEANQKFEDSESTGFVWLILQKPNADTGNDVTLK
jgi:hypothetical protein